MCDIPTPLALLSKLSYSCKALLGGPAVEPVPEDCSPRLEQLLRQVSELEAMLAGSRRRHQLERTTAQKRFDQTLLELKAGPQSGRTTFLSYEQESRRVWADTALLEEQCRQAEREGRQLEEEVGRLAREVEREQGWQWQSQIGSRRSYVLQ